MQRLVEAFRRARRDPLLIIQLVLLALLCLSIYQGYSDAGPTTIAGGFLIIVWHLRPNWFESAMRQVGRLAKRRVAPVVLVTILSFGVSAGVSLSRGIPPPGAGDEFAYLLAADTFLHGRLTNPTHPMWIHFETMQVIFQPTYSSKYPPAQGIALAAGRLAGGRAIVGVWLSTALACGLLCWCSMAWLGRRWGFLGGLLAVVHPLVLEWSQNYWGGAVAMGGGALLLGAFRRLARRPNTRDGWLLGAGMAILAFSRPYEGAGLSVLVLAALVFLTLRGKRIPSGRLIRSVGLPVIITSGLIAIGWGYLNARITGNPLEMPTMLHQRTYMLDKPFVWQAPSPEPVYHHKNMRDCEVGWSLPYYQKQRRSFAGLYSATIEKLTLYSNAGFQGCGIVMLIALCVAVSDRFIKLALAMLSLFSVVLLVETWALRHYAAPAAAVVIVLSLKTLKRLAGYSLGGRPVGMILTRACLILFVASMLTTDLRQKDPLVTSWRSEWSLDRARVLAGLQMQPGKQLVLVRYVQHIAPEEWIHNDADIDASKVVWAHDMGPKENHELLEYFKDRTIWLLELDVRRKGKPEVIPYSEEVAKDIAAAGQG